jgi:DnaJ-class molecular chaperone
VKIPYGSDEKPSYAPGDLYVIIVSSNSLNFKRENEHLHVDITISLLEALTGFKRTIPHIDESVSLERDVITNPGETIIISNKGLPIYKQEGKFGNLYVHVTIEFPYVLTDDEKKAVSKLLAGSEDIPA